MSVRRKWGSHLKSAVHPGQILKEELETRGLSGTALALKLRVPPQRINDVIGGRRALSAETALRLARYFGTTARFWINLQAAYELEVAERKALASIEEEVLPRKAA